MRRTEHERGMVLLAVLIVITIGALIGATLLVTVDAERSGAQTTLRRTQSRALAWSGAQLVMAELSQQREAMLEAIEPDIQTEWELFEDERGRAAVVRLIKAGPDESLLVSETAKLDVNHATKEMLAALPGIGTETRAQAIIDARPFTSVEELVRVEGFAADALYGFSDTPEALIAVPTEPGEGGEDAFGPDIGLEIGAPSDAALIDLLTVFSFDPNVQSGLGNPEPRGKLRVNLNVPWSDRLARAVEDQWGKDAVQVAEQLFNSGVTFGSDEQMIENMLTIGLNSAEQLSPVLDAVTTSDDMYRLGRVDILLADVEVLDALPGIDLAKAFEIVDARENLSALDRLSPMWLVQEGILTLAEFAKLSDHVTTRSTQWRVRIEAGYRAPGAIADVAGVADSVLEGMAADLSFDEPLQDRVVYDIVIDVASQRPRMAYMREVTLLDLARSLRTQEISRQIGSQRDSYEASLAAELGLDDGFDPLDDQESLDGAEVEGGGSGPSWRDGSRLDRDREDRRQRRESRASRNSDDAVDEPEPEATMPGEPVDRRIGRWRSGGGP
jgi:DNA uptake protein ComE-like DNA-binding protein